jgi:hypothetical protein
VNEEANKKKKRAFFCSSSNHQQSLGSLVGGSFGHPIEAVMALLLVFE